MERIIGWLGSKPLVADSALAVGLVAADLVSDPWRPAQSQINSWRDLLATAVIFGALALRRRWPLPVYLAQLPPAAWLYHSGSYDPLVNVAIMTALYTVGTSTRRWVSTLAAALFPLFVWQLWYLRPEGPPVSAGVDRWLNPTLIAMITVFFGQAVRQSRRRAVELAEVQRQLADEAVVRERVRIARELHDVVAHSLGVIVVRSGVGRRLAAADNAQAIESLAVIETTSRSALVEMRHLLTMLRSAEDEPEGESSRARMDNVTELIMALPQSEFPVELIQQGERYALPSCEEVAGYRIVQEALTNVLKHAGAVRTRVILRYQSAGLEIEVINDPPAAPRATFGARLPSGGQGLMGMRERLAMFGGALEVGPLPGGGFRVWAMLPAETTHGNAAGRSTG